MFFISYDKCRHCINVFESRILWKNERFGINRGSFSLHVLYILSIRMPNERFCEKDKKRLKLKSKALRRHKILLITLFDVKYSFFSMEFKEEKEEEN